MWCSINQMCYMNIHCGDRKDNTEETEEASVVGRKGESFLRSQTFFRSLFTSDEEGEPLGRVLCSPEQQKALLELLKGRDSLV